MDDEILKFSLQRDQLYKQEADQLQELIVAASLRPGDKLPGERELAEKLRVSRSVVREALRILSVRGLVGIKPGCGSYVQNLSPSAACAPISLFLKLHKSPNWFQDLYEVRRMIEVEAAGLAAQRANADDVQFLEHTLQGMAESTADPKTYTQHDLAFHLGVAEATHNELVRVLLAPITERLEEVILLSCHAPGAAEAGLNHHRHILAAVRAGQPEEARWAMDAHLATSLELVRIASTTMDEIKHGGAEGTEREEMGAHTGGTAETSGSERHTS